MEWETFREFGRLTEVRGMFITPVSAREDKQEKIYFVVYRYISNRKIRNHNETAVAGRKDHLGETGRTISDPASERYCKIIPWTNDLLLRLAFQNRL